MDEHLTYQQITEVARQIVDAVVYAVVTTVDASAAPRSRVVHPVWDWDAATGWITTRPSSLIHQHLREHGSLACAYWSPAHDSVVVDCSARSAGPAELPDVWASVTGAGGPTAFDPAPIYGEPAPGRFGAVILQPRRIRVVQAEKLPSGGPYLTWRRSHETRTTMALT